MSLIDDYLGTLNPSERAALQRIRTIVSELVPDAVEVIRYGIPTFQLNNSSLVHFGAYKDHLSLFPTSEPIARLHAELVQYKTSRGAIQFSVQDPLPAPLIRSLVTIRRDAILAANKSR